MATLGRLSLDNACPFVYIARVKTVKVFETFTSLQGESTHSGIPCFFIRLSGCNLRCSYCDTSGAWEGGTDTSIDELVSEAEEAGCPLIEVTGGEPLVQDGCVDLLARLSSIEGSKVLVETNGSQDISSIPDNVAAIMDVKCPSSGQVKWMDEGNVARLRQSDEVKFVIAEWDDYQWARDFIVKHDLTNKCNAVLFGVVHGVLDESALAEWMLADKLNARMQLQLHKVLGHQ